MGGHGAPGQHHLGAIGRQSQGVQFILDGRGLLREVLPLEEQRQHHDEKIGQQHIVTI